MAQRNLHDRFETSPFDRSTPECVALRCNLAAAFRIIARRWRSASGRGFSKLTAAAK